MRLLIAVCVVLVSSAVLAQVGGRIFSFQFTADATGTADKVVGNEDDEKAYIAIACCNASTTVVYLGDSGAVDAANGFPICTTTATCPAGACAEYDATSLYAHSSSGSVVLNCTAIQR